MTLIDRSPADGFIRQGLHSFLVSSRWSGEIGMRSRLKMETLQFLSSSKLFATV
jgi:hypothetical protein